MRLGVFGLLALGGCATVTTASPSPPPCPPPLTEALRIELLFGSSKPGGTVGDAEWRDFLAAEVTPRFPAGLTVLDAFGQWRSPATGRIGQEASRVLLLVTPPDHGRVRAAQDAADAYRVRFGQQSVGVVALPACAAF